MEGSKIIPAIENSTKLLGEGLLGMPMTAGGAFFGASAVRPADILGSETYKYQTKLL
jgi:hypothetical protein